MDHRFEIRLLTYFYLAPRLRGRIRSNCITIPVKRGVTSSGGGFRALAAPKRNNIPQVHFAPEPTAIAKSQMTSTSIQSNCKLTRIVFSIR